MKQKAARSGPVIRKSHTLLTLACVALLSPGLATVQGQTPAATPPAATQPSAEPSPPAEAEAPKISNDQLDSLVAPIALYPDPLLAQTLAASTYPLELIQLSQWMEKNKNLKDKALADAVAKQPWDPSVQAMAGVPDAVKRMAGNIQWTADLGNAFLAQQQDVMEAVQRMRTKAQTKGTLKTSKEQKVETKTVEGNKEVIVIQQSSPEVVYVPSYDPAVVYGPASYPYYPYTYPGYLPGMGLAWGTGVILGAAWANNNWGDCNWGGGDININNNNNFNRNNISNRTNVSGGNRNNWQHNPQHRGGAPYSNKNLSNKYGGDRSRGPGSTRPSTRDTAANRPGGDRTSQGPGADRNRPSTADRNRPSNTNRPSSANRPSSSNRPSTGNRPSSGSRPSSGGDRIGNHNVSRSPSPRSNNAFSSGGGNFSRSSAMSSHSRGSRSMGGSRGGGSRGGGRRR